MIYFDDLTKLVQYLTISEKPLLKELFKPNGNMTEELVEWIDSVGMHILFNMLVFINPMVSSLPEHEHLYAGEGCFKEEVHNRDGGLFI